MKTRIRRARPDEAAQIARIYVESWRDTYAGAVPTSLLVGMSVKDHSARWRMVIAAQGQECVLVAEAADRGLAGMASLGPARDADLGFGAEIYTLYVAPECTGAGVGRSLLSGGFDHLRRRGFQSCLIWAHAKNHVRFFYEAMGGRMVARRSRPILGISMPEIAFGWRTLALVPDRRVS